MTPTSRTLLLAFSALGLGASSWSSYVHYALLTRPGYTTFCDINATLSCTQAYLSQYGSVWGVPVALGGVLFFTATLLLAGLAGRRSAPGRDNAPAYIFAMSTLGLAVVLYLAWASFFKLHAVCILCTATYAAVIGLFIVAGGATEFPMTTLPRRAANDLVTFIRNPAALVLAIVAGVGAVTLIDAFPHEPRDAAAGGVPRQAAALTDGQRSEFIKWYEAQPRLVVPVDAGGAKVLIVKFNDYQCPPCRQTHLDYKPILAKYVAAGQVKFVLKHFPLESECNAGVKRDLHPAACEAAAAVVMAQTRGTDDELEDWMFANAPSLTADTIRRAAADVGKIPDFDAQYGHALTLVKTDAGLGGLLGATSTPTFFINGRRIAGGLPVPLFEAAIEYELRQRQP